MINPIKEELKSIAKIIRQLKKERNPNYDGKRIHDND
jgi:hypothetical protein